MYLKNFLRVIILIFFFHHSSYARWSKYEDSPIEIKFHNQTININKDGTFEEIVEIQAKILKESGRNIFAQYGLTYNEYSSQIIILEAKTIYNGQEYIVAKDMIEDKTLSSFGKGFDQLRQIYISFPKAELGAEIYLKYKYIKSKVPVDNFYGSTLFFGTHGYLQAANYKITSELPLNIKVNDPKKVLKIIKGKQGKFYSTEIIVQKPLYNDLVNESENDVLNVKYLTWVSLSTLTEWKDLVMKLAPRYFEVINQPLPEIFMHIAESAVNKNTDEKKIDFVTSTLNEKIQYMGDWRTVSGQFFPRDLDKIADSQIGDCKDFSASTAAILQQLGYKVQPVLVMRGITNFSNPNALPSIENFNHAMLKIVNKEGKIYWIDPTNFTSMAGRIFPDIANKQVLILSSQETCIDKIPNIQPENSEIILYNELTVNNNIIDEQGTLTLIGEAAENFTGMGLQYSKEQLRDYIFRMFSGTNLNEAEKKSLELPNLTSRIVDEITIRYELQQKKQILKTNTGSVLTLSSNWVELLTDSVPDQISDHFIGISKTITKCTTIKNNVKNCEKLNFAIDTPWVSVNRTCESLHKGTRFTDIISIRKSFITSDEMKTKEYIELKNHLETSYQKVGVTLSE